MNVVEWEIKNVQETIKKNGKRFSKKHGSWYVAKSRMGDFVLDTWNGLVSFYPNGAKQSGNDASGNVVCWHGERIIFR